MRVGLNDALFWNAHNKSFGKQKPRKYVLPLDEIASRYLAGESLKNILLDYPKIDSPKPDEVIRRQLLRRGIRKDRIPASGSKNGFWRGGKRKAPPMHFYRRQAYEIAAICQGKPLGRGEVIHHIDEIPQNNIPENMLIFASQKAHARFHQQLYGFRREGREVDTIQLALKNGAHRLQRPACLIGWKPDISPRDLLKKKQSPRGQKLFPRATLQPASQQ